MTAIESRSSLSPSQLSDYKSKFIGIDRLDSYTKLEWMAKDPTIFSYFMFRDLSGNKLLLYPYQDLIINDPSDRVAVCISRQSGKSTLAICYAFWYIFYHPRSTVLIISQTKPQAQELLVKLRDMLSMSDLRDEVKSRMAKGGDSRTEFWLNDANEMSISRIVSLAADSARGVSANLVIADEIAIWDDPDEKFNKAVSPTVAHTKGKILMLSTPKGKQGPLWFAANNPDIWSFYHYNWRICPDHTQEFMDKEVRRIGSFAFKQEYEAMFTVNQAAYFSEEEILRNTLEYPPSPNTTHPVVIGIDFGKKLDNSVVVYGYISNPLSPPDEQKIKIVNWVVWPLNTPYSKIVEDVRVFCNNHNVERVYYDATGVGGGVEDFMYDFGVDTEGIIFSIKSKLDIYSNLKLLFENNLITIPRIPSLIDQLLLFEYEYTSGGRIKLHHPEGGHDDWPDALALCAWGLKHPGSIETTMSWVSPQNRLNDDIESYNDWLRLVNNDGGVLL